MNDRRIYDCWHSVCIADYQQGRYKWSSQLWLTLSLYRGVDDDDDDDDKSL